MKRILSTILLTSFCVVQAAPMKEFSDAISKQDTVGVATLLLQNILTEPEAFELLNEAEYVLRINEKMYGKAWDYAAISSAFIFGVGMAHTLASSIASRDRLFLSATGLVLMCLGVYSLHKWKKEDEPKGREAWTNALVIQRLLYKALLDAKYSAGTQATVQATV